MNQSSSPFTVQKLADTHYAIRCKRNYCIAVLGEVDAATADNNHDNALLFAAAPELLEALERCQIRLFMLEGNCDEYELARKAIAKAKGPRNIIDPAGDNSIAAMMRRSRGEE